MHIFLVLAAVALFMYFLFRQEAPRGRALAAPLSPFERDVSTTQFAEMVLATSHQTPVLVDFYASWCPPCQAFAPLLAEIAREYNGAFLLARINFDEARDLAQHYQVTCIPTIALFKGGEQIDGVEGAQMPHQLRYFLAKNGINPSNSLEAASSN